MSPTTTTQTARRDPLSVVRAFVKEGQFQPNDRLPPDREVAKLLNLSQAQVRRSMHRLAQEGLVWRHVGKGTFLGSGPEAGLDASRAMPAASNPRELMEARLAIEPMLARLAAINASIEDLANFDAILERADPAGNPARFQREDAALHLAIARASSNSLLYGFLQAIFSDENQALWGRLKQKILTQELLAEYHQQHSAIVAALRDRDPDAAAQMMLAHLSIVRAQLFPH